MRSQLAAFDLQQVCVCVCKCVCFSTRLCVGIYGMGSEQKRTLLISSRDRHELLYCVRVHVCMCVRVRAVTGLQLSPLIRARGGIPL